MKTGANSIINVLKRRNIEFVHGYSGGAILPLLDKFHHSSTAHDIKFITHQNEQCAGHAAQGFAKSTGKPGVVASTSGPGLTNLVTPILDAYADGDPMIILSAQVARSAIGTGAFQEAPSIEITKAITKWNYQIQSSDEIDDVMEYAFDLCNSGRPGPVHIDIPKDVQTGTMTKPIAIVKPELHTEYFDPNFEQKYNVVTSNDIVDLIIKAKKPIIIAGKGCLDCSYDLRRFAYRYQIPVTTTIHGMGCFDETSSLSLNMLGMHGSAAANYAVQEADLIIGLGTRFDDRTTGAFDKYAPEAYKAAKEGRGGIVSVDISQTHIGKTIKPTHIVISSCDKALKYLNCFLHYQDFTLKRLHWIACIQNLRRCFPFNYEATFDNRIKVQDAIREINAQNNKETYYTTGVGNHQMMAAQYIDWRFPRSIITSGSLGTMGSGLPFAIGAQLAHPNSQVINIDGDGSFNMTSVDLATVARLKLPIKIALMNDSRQQMVYVWQKLFFDGRITSTENENPDYKMIAQAYGIEYIRIDSKDNLVDGVTRMIESKGPVLAEFVVCPDICTPLVAPGKGLDDMILYDPSLAVEEMIFDGDAPC